MTAVDLPQPDLPRGPVRRQSRQIHVAGVPVGGDAPVSVQSMTTTPTANVDATLQQIAELTAAGCDIVRVAVPSQDDADALPAIAAKSKIPSSPTSTSNRDTYSPPWTPAAQRYGSTRATSEPSTTR